MTSMNMVWPRLLSLLGLACMLLAPACLGISENETGTEPSSSLANGLKIYFTGTTTSGNTIVSRGFSMMGRNYACADCHGTQGQGGRVTLMMQQVDVPAVTWPELRRNRAEHFPYTEATVKRAITEGINPAGKPLDRFMPRWEMPDRDLDDLIAFMKTLE
jgi:cytochrome c oxidase subunit II